MIQTVFTLDFIYFLFYFNYYNFFSIIIYVLLIIVSDLFSYFTIWGHPYLWVGGGGLNEKKKTVNKDSTNPEVNAISRRSFVMIPIVIVTSVPFSIAYYCSHFLSFAGL